MEIEFEKELSERLTDLIGYPLYGENVHSDNPGFNFYIKGLEAGRPLIMMHYSGNIMAVIPYADFKNLESGEVTVKDYIDKSHFYYGYFWGDGHLLNSVYWQQLEETTGIHDRDRISRYFHILKCRTLKYSVMYKHRYSWELQDKIKALKHSVMYKPTAENCKNCQLEESTCPFSPFNETGSWENEIKENDNRILFTKAVNQRLKDELGYKVSDFMPSNIDIIELLLFPGEKSGTVNVYVNKDLLNGLLYYSNEKHNWSVAIKNFNITLAAYWQGKRCQLPSGIVDKHKFCQDFWKKNTLPISKTDIKDDYLGKSKRASPLKFLKKFFLKE